MIEDEKWMQVAIQEAILAEKEGEVPVGAVLVNNRIIARAHNLIQVMIQLLMLKFNY